MNSTKVDPQVMGMIVALQTSKLSRKVMGDVQPLDLFMFNVTLLIKVMHAVAPKL